SVKKVRVAQFSDAQYLTFRRRSQILLIANRGLVGIRPACRSVRVDRSPVSEGLGPTCSVWSSRQPVDTVSMGGKSGLSPCRRQGSASLAFFRLHQLETACRPTGGADFVAGNSRR